MTEAISTEFIDLPHGITLECRTAGPAGAPVVILLHGFPEGAFVWDDLIDHLVDPANGGFRCVAPNLRGYGGSSSPDEISAYRASAIATDVGALIATVSPDRPLAALIAHDWGGAAAWAVANAAPHLMSRLIIINSPHPGTFIRDIQHDPVQQAASQYMNVLAEPDMEERLSEDGFRRLWAVLEGFGSDAGAAWLTPEVRAQYENIWSVGLTGPLNFYRASPVRPAASADDPVMSLALPRSMLTVDVPTTVIWGMRDQALLPTLLDGLDDYVADLTVHRIDGASHWVVHEQPELVAALVDQALATPPN